MQELFVSECRVSTKPKTLHGRFGWIKLDDLHYKHGRSYWAWPAYGQSKMGDLLWAKELSRR